MLHTLCAPVAKSNAVREKPLHKRWRRIDVFWLMLLVFVSDVWHRLLCFSLILCVTASTDHSEI